jgi:hypothetical protein
MVASASGRRRSRPRLRNIRPGKSTPTRAAALKRPGTELRLLVDHPANLLFEECSAVNLRRVAGKDNQEVRYRVWFEGEQKPRSRYFESRSHACQWASANQPNRPFEVTEERRGVVRRLSDMLRKR